ncbi:hypothetical protein K491DRAFT_716458 [Lophiostoma macrostomum CBS 122681]|uniref:Zn(2)-C6 fungal-type domain-containing protein n=1 Tax=Lophiostoma macrostomum CBS 122681 TaxID=1314788 RepID=A0A6A6T5U7_9PLEO|nr:hypothetical protein K491DRAFT_716458 [Lophiostoma macrostomum CBS 122681]
MASGPSYHDTDAQIGASGLYGHQNGGTPPAQQAHHLTTDADIQMQDSLAQLQRSSDIIHAGGPQGHQMNAALSAAHHHFHTPPRPTHSPQQMAQTVMNLEDANMYSDQDGGSRSNKRSKVSRACDECRRKKIRCDATSENGPQACSSCKKTGARCQFSRQPMKRGPSKGYIKELADRLNSLENQIQNPHAPGQTYDYTNVTDAGLGEIPTPSQLTRKRTHSMSEGLQEGYTRQNWFSQDHLVTNGLPVRRPSFNDMTLASNLMTGSNDGTIKAYYSTIHSMLPILAHETPSLNRLSNCPAKLRETFFTALECCIRAYSPSSLPPADVGLAEFVRQCSAALENAQHDLSDTDSSRQFYNNLVYCQCLVFLIVAGDKPGPSESGNTADLLGRLAGRISELGLNNAKVVLPLREADRETFDDCRRLFWVAFILDRFHAAARSKDPILPVQCGTVSRDDFIALSEPGYHLARAADIVGQITFISCAGNIPNPDPLMPPAISAILASSPETLYLKGQLSRFWESLDFASLPNTSPPQLAYQYLRILVARSTASTSSKETLDLTKHLLLNLTSSPITPLHHIFARLVATSLIDLADRLETQVEAHASIKEMDDTISNGHLLHRVPNGTGWDTAIRNMLRKKRAPTPSATSHDRTSPTIQPNMAGLQHLAAAAVGERDSADARPTSSGGNGVVSQPSDDGKHDVTAAMAAASEAAAAQATAAAAQKQLQNALGNSNGGNSYDPSALVKDGL